jgi:hypothetical protein
MILAVLILLSCVSCVDEKREPTTQESESSSVTDKETEDPRYVCELPADLDYQGQTVTMVVAGGEGHTDEFLSDNLNGSVVSDAVYERNLSVEDMLSIKLEFIVQNSVIEAVDLDIQGGTCDYEIVDNVTYAACNPAIGGKYLNLTTLESIDTSKYYWNQGYNDMSSFTHDRIQYLASGSLAISMYRLAFMTLYNRTLFEEYQIEDLYKTVMDGKWTLDKQYALMKDHYYDKDGDGRVSQGDFFGFVTGDTISVDPYLVTSDIHMISQAPDTGNLIFNKEEVARVSDLCDKVQLIYNDSSAYVYKGLEDIVATNGIINHFMNENALMVTSLFYKMETNYDRLAELSYGIAPIPKYDELQKEYHSYVQAAVSSFGISAGVGGTERQEKCAATLEAMAYHSYLLVRPAYYEAVLSDRYMQDPQSMEVLNLIFDTLDFDFASCWSDILGSANIRNGLRPVLSGDQNTVSSTFRSWERSLEKMLIKYNAQIVENTDSQT